MADFLKKETRSRLQSVAGQEIKHAKCTADGPLLRWVRRTVPEIRAGVLDLVRAVLAPRELPTSRRSVPGGAAMNRDPHNPRPRCWRCKGRRVIVVDHFDFIELKPCPSCNQRDPSGRRRKVDPESVRTWAVAA